MSVDTNTLAIELEQIALLLELGRQISVEVESALADGAETACEHGCCCVDGML